MHVSEESSWEKQHKPRANAVPRPNKHMHMLQWRGVLRYLDVVVDEVPDVLL